MKAVRSIAIVFFFLTANFLFSIPNALCQSTYIIRGRVVDESGGYIPGASVYLYSVERVLEVKADGDGRFEFPNVAKGSYELEGSYLGFERRGLDFEIAEKVPEPFSIMLLIGGTHSYCTVLQTDGGARPVGVDVSYENRSGKVDLMGLVRDELGSPLSNVILNLVREGASHETTSNDKGEFTYTGLEPGKYTLHSPRAGYWDIPHSVWVTRDNLTRSVVTLADKRRVPCFG